MNVADSLYCAALILLFLVIATCLWQEKSLRISATPTLPWVKRRALALLRAHTDADKAYQIADLGCGWGGILLSLAKLYPNAHLTGYEASLWPYWASRLKAAIIGRRLTVLRQDFFRLSLAEYDIIFCYLSPYHMDQLRPQLAALAPGSIVISNAFPIPGWEPTASDMVGGIVKIPIFLYRIAGEHLTPPGRTV